MTATHRSDTLPQTGAPSSNAVERMALLGLRQPPDVSATDVATGAIARLRTLVPKRPLGLREAEHTAERQATRLRAELEVLSPALREIDLARLSWLTITRREDFPTSGMAIKTDYGWIIALNSADAAVRQRFSLAHEIKHILDDGLIDLRGGRIRLGMATAPTSAPSASVIASPERCSCPRCSCGLIGPTAFRTWPNLPSATTSPAPPCASASASSACSRRRPAAPAQKPTP